MKIKNKYRQRYKDLRLFSNPAINSAQGKLNEQAALRAMGVKNQDQLEQACREFWQVCASFHSNQSVEIDKDRTILR
jgi:hypothetical protein